MKAVMLMFDSLNRHLLEPYGCDWTMTPNFRRLGERSVRFDSCFAGSLPCMPARRELHTGRFNFLHRSWGPVEPFDDSMPELLKNSGVYTHLVSDHTHYWEDGGATYHNRYSSWENVRGQEGDKWKCLPELFRPAEEAEYQNRDGEYFHATGDLQRHDFVNRQFEPTEADTPLVRTLDLGIDFIDRNHACGPWFLQIECFDPHEPFFADDRYKALYPDAYEGKTFDWPPYHHVTEDDVTKDHLRKQYAALLSMCDAQLGRVLDAFDRYGLWEDTMLIVNTDHGYLLGEHNWWSKVVMPCYDEIVHLPLFIHDPRLSCDGEARGSLVQTIDLPATLLEFFGVPLPKDMQGRPLRKVMEKDEPVREYALFGIHGAHVNVFDGRYVYMKAPVSEANQPLYEYTLLPLHMRNLFSAGELENAGLVPGDSFSFLKNCPVLRIPKGNGNGKRDFSDLLVNGKDSEEAKHIDNNSLVNAFNFGDKLFDLKEDPAQAEVLSDLATEVRMANLLVKAMRENESPAEQFERLGLPGDRLVEEADILALREKNLLKSPVLPELSWTRGGVNAYQALFRFIPAEDRERTGQVLTEALSGQGDSLPVSAERIVSLIPLVVAEEYAEMIQYFVALSGRTA